MSQSFKAQVLVVPERQQGQRLDNFLLRELKGLPRTRVYRLIRTGEVRVNRGRCKPDTRLSSGDQVRVPPYTGSPPPQVGTPTDKLKQKLADSVLFENDALLVLNKPAGMSVHGGSGVTLGLIKALRQCRPEWMEAELAHRLDRDTSGCLIIAKQADFLRHVQAELRAGRVEKTYLALVQGAWPQQLDKIDLPLRKNELASGERIVRANSNGKSALTLFKVLERLSGATLLQIKLETGRTHQIRVHCQAAGHPIIGDNKYSKNSPIPHKHLALHAWRIALRTTPNANPSHFEAPPNQNFTQLLNSLTPLAGHRRRIEANF